MKSSHFSVFSAAALALVAGLAQANDSNSNTQDTAKDKNAASYESRESQDMSKSDSLKSNAQAKMTVGPHSLMVQSVLMSSKDMVNGMKSQLDLAENSKPGSEYFSHFKMYDKAIGKDISTAKTHETELKGSLQKYPGVAKTDAVQKLDSAMNDLSGFFNSWSSKSKSNDYWSNKAQAKNDLDALSKKIDAAIDQSKQFNSDQLDISIG
jgi:hypothetical protein